ncbi:G-box-binding factor 4-like isoform X2 [Cicer arietinum]|uniref:G-box-binding factor 4-like n=2 Tax=Cicer arietinum TaxID=3827 RepID=A0A1S2XYG2_CICAR|nr:G-box-binding factor 4-like [Cicer arietinum]XP_004496458.1 G-box-binding factor 4-like [Cicer arietinum]
MASSKLMASSNSINSDPPSSPSSKSQFTTTNFLDNSTLLDSQISLADAVSTPRTVDDVWREIVAGDRRDCKEEIPDEMMTLEDFLVKAGAVDDEDDGDDVKMTIPLTETLSGSGMFAVDPTFQGIESVEGSVIGFGNGVEVVEGARGKRGRPVLEQLDKAAQQRQRRMIKNRESAARSRERKQAYQVELESLAVKLEEENDKLLKEKAERTKERFKQLMEKVIPVVEQRKPPRLLRRIRSWQW